MQGVDAVLNTVALICIDYCWAVLHAKKCRELGGTEGKCWFYGPGACAGCHTSIHITDVLPLEGQLSRYKAIIWSYVRVAPLRRRLLAMPFKTYLTILHHTYQFAPSKSGRPSPWWSVFTLALLRRPEGLRSPLHF